MWFFIAATPKHHAAWAVKNFSPLLARTILFHCVQRRKSLLSPQLDSNLWNQLYKRTKFCPRYDWLSQKSYQCGEQPVYLPTVPISSGQSRFGDRNPTSRPTTPKSRFIPFCPINAQKHDFKPAFCLFSLFFSRNSSFFCVFWPFLMYPSVVDSYPSKKSAYFRALFWLKSSFSCHFPLNARKLDIFKAYFSCSKCLESLTKH